MANISCGGLSGVKLQMCDVLNVEPFGCDFNQYIGADTQGLPICVNYTSPVEKMTGQLGDQAMLDAGNTAFMLACTALVMIMTPGVGLFYAGLAGEETAANTLMMSVSSMVLVTFQWFFVGYTFAFGPGTPGFGSFDWFCLMPITWNPSAVYGLQIPHILYVVFQLMFAQITPALISGAVIGRMKFTSWLVFVLIWTTLIYDPLAHWFWSFALDADFKLIAGGWLGQMGAVDFAGGSVIHISSGWSALACALVLGKRYNHSEKLHAHNIPMVIQGAAFIWFGWFGFNAGSAGGAAAALTGVGQANGIASIAFLNTHVAACCGSLSWVLIEYLLEKRMTPSGAAAGAVAGLVAITPACGFVEVYAAVIFGLIVSPICYGAHALKTRMGIDDTLDSWALHGVGGMVGSILTGLFADPSVNFAAGGFYYDGGKLLGANLLGVVVSASYSFFGTLIIMFALKFTMGVRISDAKETEGIDVSEHGGKSYQGAH